METICDCLMFGHQRCDELFTRAATSIGQCKWDEAGADFQHFYHALKQHITMEESVLFPAFEQTLTDSGAPLAMLRREHLLIHGILDRMSGAVNRSNAVDFLLHAETFTILMHQHSIKEEDMLYPLLDKMLSDGRSKIVAAMSSYIEVEG